MRPAFLLTHKHHPAYTRAQTAEITRSRAAYLLRAARSRGLAEIHKTGRSYVLHDCNVTLEPLA